MSAVFTVLDVDKRYAVGRAPRTRWLQRGAPRQLHALDGVRLEIAEGDAVALVGESGSGKSTLVRLMLGLEPATEGRLLYRNAELAALSAEQRRAFARDVAFVYQDARGSMNPRMRVGDVIAEPIRLHALAPDAEVPSQVAALLERVGLPAAIAERYPGELSGGQVRRVAVARALAARPRVIIADESVAGLDVSVQAQLLNLLRDLRREMGLTLVFITHDLGVASYLCDRVAVMYLGRVVEEGPTAEVLRAPRHPYTRALMQSFPSFDRPLGAPIAGEIPSPVDLPPGCRFASRCPQARAECRSTDPVLSSDLPGRRLACLYPLSVQPQSPQP